MKNKLVFSILSLSILFLYNCKSDDDGTKEPSVTDQNTLDDQAIIQYMDDHYFEPNKGFITAFDTIANNDDDVYPSLHSLAVQTTSGIWYIKRPGVETPGEAATNPDTQKILMNFNSQYFVASDEYAETTGNNYMPLTTYSSTINGSGIAIWDPSFYHISLTDAQLESGYLKSYFEIEGFQEGLTHFNATNRNLDELYNFQGAIIVPSRLAFGRDKAYSAGYISDQFYRNYSFIFNFELLKVENR